MPFYNFTSVDVKNLRDEKGYGVIEAINILKKRELIKRVRTATTVEELRYVVGELVKLML